MLGSAARFSPCMRYRYGLDRIGPGRGQTCVIMVNPSTADEYQDDPTIRRVIGFGARNSWGAIAIGNLFAYRATDIRELARVEDPVGAMTDFYLLEMMREAERVVVAWGPVAKLPRHLRSRYLKIVELAHASSRMLWNIGPLARDGQPRHPLMLSYEETLRPWSPPT